MSDLISNVRIFRRGCLVFAALLCLALNTSAFAQQKARPASTIDADSFTSSSGSQLWQDVDEATAVDTDYIESPESGTAFVELGMAGDPAAVTDPGIGTGHVLRIRMLKSKSGTSGTLMLYQGTTQIATTGSLSPGSQNIFETFTYNLTTGEADAITDYNALSIRIQPNGLAKNKFIQVSWVEFEIPDPVVVVTPTVDTPTFSAVTDTTATLGGTVSDDGGATVTDRGTVWGTSPNPTGNSLSQGSGTGPFTHARTGLPPSTLIYFRAYATNSAGTSYSADGSFTTNAPPTTPTVTTPTFSAVTDTTATLGGTVSDDGGATVTDRGTVWGTSPNPTGNSLSQGSGTGAFTHARTGLPADTLIYFRAYATNSVGISYSADGSFTTTTPASPPTVDTPTFSAVTATTATLGGTVSDDGGATVTDRGTVWGTSPSPTGNSLSEGSGAGAFSHARTGLPAATLIYFRAYATNSVGTSWSTDGSFTTLANPPTVDTPTSSAVTDTTATLGGTVSDDGGATVTDRGTVWGTSPSPTGNSLSQGSGTGTFTHARTGLPSGTLIYFRAYAINSAGTSYSADGSFTTLTTPTVETPTFSAVTDTTATLGGTVSDDGGTTVTDRGTVWGTSPSPTGNSVSQGSGTGAFTHARTGLPSGTLIYFRAYATNSVGTSFSTDGTFTTLPTVSTPTFADVTATTATLGGTVASAGAAPVNDRGTVWGTSPNPTGNSLSEGSGVGSFNHSRNGLPPATLIYFRAYATNAGGTAFSADNSFTTLIAKVAPTVTSPTVSSVSDTGATLGGDVSSDGNDTITERGTVWGLVPDPDIISDNKIIVSGTTGPFTGPVTGLSTGTQIFYRAYASNSIDTSYSGNGSFFTEPASQASSVTFSNITTSGMRISWNAGDGDGSLVVVKSGSAPSGPTDGTLHSDSVTFGGGADLGGNSYVVFRASGTFVDVSNLQAETTYYVAVYEYAGTVADTTPGSITGINYKPTPATGNQQTDTGAAAPTVTSPTVSDASDTAATLGGNVTNDGGDAITERGTVWGLVPNPDIVSDNKNMVSGTTGPFTGPVSGLNAGTRIFYRAYATNPRGTSYSSGGSFFTEPAIQASSVSFSSVTDISMWISWNAGDGNGSLVVVKAGSAPTGPTDGILHSASETFGSGDDLGGGSYVVFRAFGQGSQVNVSNLTAGTTYYVAVYEYAGTVADTTPGSINGINYKPVPATANQLAASVPKLDASTFSAVGTSTATLGGNVSSDSGESITSRGTSWNTTGAPITQNLLAEGGTSTGSFTHARSGMDTGSKIFFQSYAVNGIGTGRGPVESFHTEPANSPASVTIDLPTVNGFRVFWPAPLTGDGDGVIVVVRESSAVTATPTDGVEHAFDANFGSGEDLGTAEYVVYRGNGAFVNVSGLSEDTTYHVAVFYSAGTGAGASGINYRETAPATGSQLTETSSDEPRIQASSIVIDSVASKSMRIKWSDGDGDGSIVTMRLQGTAESPPLDFTDYTADADFTLAPETSGGSQNYVVYKNTGKSVSVSKLSTNTTYTITVYAWGGFAAATDYLHTNPPEVNQITDGPAMHNQDNGVDCGDCHTNHGGGGFVPRGTNVEAVCTVCHQLTGEAPGKLDFAMHNTPTYPADDVDCGSCHEIHRINAGASNTTQSTNPVTSSTDYNISFIRSNVDKYISTATPDDAVYHVSNDDTAIEGGDASTSRGLCQSCHTQVGNHRHDGSGEQCHDGNTNDSCGPAQVDCLGCHTHTGNFLPSGGGGCTGCHSSAKTPRREIVSEFSRLSTHIDPGSVADSDCEVCHAQAPTDNSHIHNGPGDKRVTLWNADDHATSYQLGIYGDPTTSHAEATLLNPVCLSCHDGDGAQAEASPAQPFTGSVAPKNIAATWSGSSHATVTPSYLSNPTSCFGDGAFGCHGSGHGGEKLTLLAPAGTAATGPDFSEQREGFCLNCHDSDGSSDIDIDQYLGGAATNIQETAGLQYTTVNQRHDILPADQTYSSATVTCNDCHSPHLDNNNNPVANPDTGAALATYNKSNSYSGDATGFAYAWSGSDYDPTNPEGGSSIPEPDHVEFCLVCHDGTAPAGVTLPPGGSGMLNMADMYRANDQHGRLEGGGSASRGYMKQPWANSTNYDAGDQPSQVYAALNCTLCHGAHGSGNIYNLRTSITVNGTAMTVGGKDSFMDPALCTKQCSNINNALPEFGSTTYLLPEQTDMSWGAWCTFCHEPSHGTSDGTGCQSGHRHGGGNF